MITTEKTIKKSNLKLSLNGKVNQNTFLGICKKERGITLIALVVTIIVLVILATVSMNVLMGEDGIIKKAEKGAQYYANAEASDREALREYDKMLANILSEIEENDGNEPPEITDATPAGQVVKTPEEWTTLVGEAISDGNGTAIPLPSGFYYIGGDYDTGLVISDKENDTMDASGVTSGNQFVWIPVEGEETFIRQSFGGSSTSLSTIYTEPLNYKDGETTYTGYSTEEAEYNKMKTQVVKYGGFYIGRYEAGVNSTTLRTGPTSTAQEVVTKKGVAPYNYIGWGDSMTSIGTNGAVYIAQNMYTGKMQGSSVTSTLVYGVQLDSVCRYIGEDECTATIPTKTAPELTGSVSLDESKNIYDLARNCSEWTMESMESSARVHRGGHYEDVGFLTFSIYSRRFLDPHDNDADAIGFRVALYVKLD